jgi:D-3-phosphoglycerate dehydrogenase
MKKLLVAECQDFSTEALAILRQRFDVELADLDRVQLLRSVGNCEVLWVRLRNMIDAEVLAAAPNLQMIATNTTGLNHIDLDAAESRGIKVISLRGEIDFLKTIRATAEHTIGLTLALLRKIPAAHRHVCEGHWDRTKFQGSEIYEKTVGIIGFGRLGKIVAQYFQAFGAQVIVCDRTLPASTTIDGFQVVDIEHLLQSADIISLHVNYEPGNRHMIGAREFAMMKSGASFINTARGELVDEAALLAALERRSIAGAAIDVVHDEHLSKGVPQMLGTYLRRFDNLIMTPHVGGNTFESSNKTEVFLSQLVRQIYSVACSQPTCSEPVNSVS